MSAYGFACVLRGCNLGQHFGIGVTDARKIHHLAQANDTWPSHGLCHIFCTDFKTSCFHAGS